MPKLLKPSYSGSLLVNRLSVVLLRSECAPLLLYGLKFIIIRTILDPFNLDLWKLEPNSTFSK